MRAILIVLVGSAPALAQDFPCQEELELAEVAASILLSNEDASEILEAAQTDLPRLRSLVSDDEQSLRDWLVELERSSDAPLACGVAQGERWAVVAAPRAGRLRVVDQSVQVELASGFRDAYVAFQDSRGRLRREAMRRALPMPEDLVAPIRVQLIATGRNGPRPIAELTVGLGAAAAQLASEGGFEERIAALRDLAEVRDVRRNRLLMESARQHARQVCASGRTAHVLEPGADPTRRMRSQGIEARVFGEVVARSSSADAAFAALVESPSHRMVLVDRRFTDVGWAAMRRGDRVCVVVDFAAWPRFVGR